MPANSRACGLMTSPVGFATRPYVAQSVRRAYQGLISAQTQPPGRESQARERGSSIKAPNGSSTTGPRSSDPIRSRARLRASAAKASMFGLRSVASRLGGVSNRSGHEPEVAHVTKADVNFHQELARASSMSVAKGSSTISPSSSCLILVRVFWRSRSDMASASGLLRILSSTSGDE